MKLESWIKKLHKKRIVSKAPHPLLPFALFLIILIAAVMINSSGTPDIFSCVAFGLAGFALIFSIIHWLVWRIVK